MSKSEFNEKEIKEKLNWHIERALTKIGLLVQGEARVICPVDTGNLRNSITYQVQKMENEVQIGTNVEYAVFVEKGIGQRPQPYLTPAGEQNINRIQKIISEEMRDI